MSIGNIGSAASPVVQTAQAARAAQTEKATETQRTGQDYLQDLQNRYPNANISVGDVGNIKDYAYRNDGDMNNVAIHPDALDKFAKDPAAAAKFEDALRGFLDSEQQDKDYAASQGMVMTGRGLYVDKDGNIGAWAVGHSKMGDDGMKSGREIREEMQKAADKKAEKEREEKKAEEKREKERAELEELLGRTPQKQIYASGGSMDEVMRNLSFSAADERFLDIRA